MNNFTEKIAVVTGGGTGMGRSLVHQLAAEGCHVATCDVNEDNLAAAVALASGDAPAGTRVTSFVADVSDASAMDAFASHVWEAHDTDHIHLLFNNAGIAGGGSLVADAPEAWERTFNVCWGGVYNGCRSFLPMLLAADEGHVINTSSVNGLFASVGPDRPHTAYSAAKFAVRGLTEALIADLRVNAPHVHAHLVCPGHIGTDIVINTFAAQGGLSTGPSSIRAQAVEAGVEISDEQVQELIQHAGTSFRDDAPMSADEAAIVILDGVRAGEWRILVGDDAHVLDRMVREDPIGAYEGDFYARMSAAGGLSPPTWS